MSRFPSLTFITHPSLHTWSLHSFPLSLLSTFYSKFINLLLSVFCFLNVNCKTEFSLSVSMFPVGWRALWKQNPLAGGWGRVHPEGKPGGVRIFPPSFGSLPFPTEPLTTPDLNDPSD